MSKRLAVGTGNMHNNVNGTAIKETASKPADVENYLPHSHLASHIGFLTWSSLK
jgi:hypothetical protein